MSEFPTYNGTLGDTIVSIKFSPFNHDDSKLFRKYCDLWFKMACRQLKGGLAPEEFLLTVVKDNCLALDENSDSISSKWIAELSVNNIWSSLFNDSPFKLSIDKVCIILSIDRTHFLQTKIYYRYNWTFIKSENPLLWVTMAQGTE